MKDPKNMYLRKIRHKKNQEELFISSHIKCAKVK